MSPSHPSPPQTDLIRGGRARPAINGVRPPLADVSGSEDDPAPRTNGSGAAVAVCRTAATPAQRARTADLLFKSSRMGLRLNPRMQYEIWEALGVRIAARADSTSWWLGDWVNFGEQKYGQRYRRAMEATGLDNQTLRNYAVVARRFDLSRRRDNLSFQHHAEVCALPLEEQDRWLDLAVANHWSKQELRLRVRAAKMGEAHSQDGCAVRFTVDVRRQELWRCASARSGCSFEEWVVRSLDTAAGVITVGDDALAPRS